MPQVLNKYKHGFPPGSVYIGRPSKWGNPFVLQKGGDRAAVLERYRYWIIEQKDLIGSLSELRGKDLVCFCHPLACHGDVLLELANKEESVAQETNCP